MRAARPDRSRRCAEVTRRDFLRVGGLGLASCGMPVRGVLDMAPSGPKAERSVILLLLVGGPSQLETFDPKPHAPAEIRGPFGSIATRIPGLRVSEHLPRLAARMDRVALVRSVHHDEAPIHETGYQLLQTGTVCRAGEESPHFGSVVAQIDGDKRERAAGGDPARPDRIDGRGHPAWPVGRMPRRRLRAALPAPENSVARSDRFREDDVETTFERSCMAAARLVDSGVRVVTVNMFETVFGRVTWDCHGASPFSTFDDYAREAPPDIRSSLRRSPGLPREIRPAGLHAGGGSR